MAELRTNDIRNVIVISHSGAGKTSLCEALLFAGGAIKKLGRTDDGTSTADYNEDEIERKISINSAVLNLTHNGVKINIIDAPGYADFFGEVLAGLRVADSAILVISGADGIEVGTERAWKAVKEANLPAAIFVNKMDKELADFSKCVDDIKKRFGKNCAVASFPIREKTSLKGVANFITKTGLDQLDSDAKSMAEKFSESLAEAVAETEDALLEKYLDKGELSEDEIKQGLKNGIKQGKVVPIFAGCATSEIGTGGLLEAIVNYLPSPADRPPVEAVNPNSNETVEVEPKSDGSFAAQVFKTISDPYIGQLSVFRVFQGKLQSNTSFFNVTTQAREKIGQVFSLQAKQQSPQEKIIAGDIGCTAKLKNTNTGDSLAEEKKPLKFKDINFPEPAISFSIKPKTRHDEGKISDALHKLAAEDPTFRLTRDVQTKEMIASGMGELHLKIMLNRMQKRFGVGVEIGTPKIAYKETITTKGGSQYRHKKQSGGAGQFAEVWMRVEPLPKGTGFEFVDEVVGGAIPAQFVVSCEKGVKASMESGALAGFPIVDVRAVVYDGKTHPVDSKDIAFQIAARHAFKESCMKAKPVILEPIMDVDFVIPDAFMGDITGSLSSRRGRIMGMEPGAGSQTIKSKVPLAEMYKYANELKSLTQGRGTYSMRFSHYEEVPSNIAQQIIEQAKEAKEEAKE